MKMLKAMMKCAGGSQPIIAMCEKEDMEAKGTTLYRKNTNQNKNKYK